MARQPNHRRLSDDHPAEARSEPLAEYAASFNFTQRAFPFILFVPADPDEYVAGVEANKEYVEQRLLREQDYQVREGRLASRVVVRPVVGTLHQGLDAYAADVDRTGERLVSGSLEP